MDSAREINRELAERYDTSAFMYVEYPHKSFWSREFSEDDLKAGLFDLFVGRRDPVLLYVHMPYCQKQCLFCTCHVLITSEYERVRAYLDVLYQEIELYRRQFKEWGVRPQFKEIHLGGGSPTFLNEEDFQEMVRRLGTIADVANLDEFSIEIDPRRVKQDRMRFYHRMGINRISFGIQDFDPKVQKAVDRLQPAFLTERLLTPDIRALFPNGVNFDIICGLPHQTVESIRATMETVAAMNPDRVCLNYLDYSPQTVRFAPHQLLMPDEAIPRGYERKRLFLAAREVLERSGYLRTGYDHFAKPADGVGKAMKEKKMIWNSLGVTPGRCVDLLGIGVHSYSRLGPRFYAQSTYDLGEYERMVLAGHFPVFRGYQLSDDDVLRREVIHALRSYFFVSFQEIEQKFSMVFAEYFRDEIAALSGFVQDGLVEVSPESIKITELGQQFANLVCRAFDRYVS